MTHPLVFIDGDQGTTGLQIHERLRGRTDLRLLTLPEAERKNATRRAEAINSCDIAILCLPDAPAREAAASIVNPAVRVIVLAGAGKHFSAGADLQWMQRAAQASLGDAGEQDRTATPSVDHAHGGGAGGAQQEHRGTRDHFPEQPAADAPGQQRDHVRPVRGAQRQHTHQPRR